MGAELDRFNSDKLLAHPEKLDAIIAGEMPFPIDWHIFPSNKCNHKCVWCMYRQNGEQFNFAKILPREVLLRGVRDAARTGANLIHFSGGGEPLINKHTPEAMELAQALGRERPMGRRHELKIALSTNGRLLTPEIARLVDYIRVSLNAGTAEQHTATNHAGEGPGDWHTILENIAKAEPYARQDLGLGFVVDHLNYRDIYAFCEVAAKLFNGRGTHVRQRFVHIRPAFYYDPTDDAATRACMPEALELCDKARRDFEGLVDIHALTDKFDGYWTPRSYTQCRAVLTGTTLRATGDFAVCQDRVDLTFGNVPSYKDGASFEDVWYSDEHRAVIASIYAGAELDTCPRCVWGGRNKRIDAWERDELRINLV